MQACQARLAELRQTIAQLDRDLLQAVQARMQIAAEIGACKQRLGLPVRDFGVEAEVHERARQTGEALGLDHEISQALTTTLIDAAVRTQHQLHTSPSDPPDLDQAFFDVLVVGGRGRMGTWLAQVLKEQGHRVASYDTTGALEGFASLDSLDERARSFDFVLLCTPLGATAAVLDRLVDLRVSGIVADICSLKSPLLASIQRAQAAGVRICSVHPLFAPGPRALSGRILALCDCGDPQALKAVQTLLAPTTCRIVELGLEEHDALMACVLGLSHATSISLALALRTSGWSPYDLDRVASTTYTKQMRTTREVAYENPQLYYEIQHQNLYTSAMLEKLEEAVRRLRAAAEDPNPTAFITLMQDNRAWFDTLPFPRLDQGSP